MKMLFFWLITLNLTNNNVPIAKIFAVINTKIIMALVIIEPPHALLRMCSRPLQRRRKSKSIYHPWLFPLQHGHSSSSGGITRSLESNCNCPNADQ